MINILHDNITPQSVSDYLQSKGIRASHQRIIIMDYMMRVNIHPSADMVYEALSPSMTTLSKATVYNTLNLFVQKGALRMVSVDPVEKRFDADMSLHGHFRCNYCGTISDLNVINKENLLSSIDYSYNKHSLIDVYISGKCSKCEMITEQNKQININ